MYMKGEVMIAQDCRILLKRHMETRQVLERHVLEFDTGEKNVDVYNISAPFSWEERTLLLGRVEPRDSEFSHILCFEAQGDRWIRREDFPDMALQDPFFAKIGDELIVGGVEVFFARPGDVNLSWRTVFYRGGSLAGLRRFAQGPEMMKDIRLCQLPNGRILLLTRPNGKIGWIVLNDLCELTPERLAAAPLLEDHFVEGQWGGANELHPLSDGTVGVLSHIAAFDDAGDRHYYSSAFRLDPDSGRCTPMKIIACRDDFLPGAAKRPDLRDVIFSGGLICHGNGLATLYCGISDAGAQCAVIPDPFAPMPDKGSC